MKSTCPALTISKFWSKFKGNTSNSRPQLTKICAQGFCVFYFLNKGPRTWLVFWVIRMNFSGVRCVFSGLSLPKNLEKNLGLSTYTSVETFFLHRFFKPLQSQQVLPFPTCPQAIFVFKILKLHFSINQVVKNLHQDTIGIIIGVGQVFLKSWSKCLNECICTLDG